MPWEPRGIDLLALPTGALLRLGSSALVALTGLRNPCKQIDGIADGLLAELRAPGEDGQAVRRAGVMGVVLQSGAVRPGDAIALTLPPSPHAALDRV